MQKIRNGWCSVFIQQPSYQWFVGCRCLLYLHGQASLRSIWNYISYEAVRCAGESMEYPLRLRIQTWQRHHGFLEPLRESDERGKNVHIGVVGKSNENSLCNMEIATHIMQLFGYIGCWLAFRNLEKPVIGLRRVFNSCRSQSWQPLANVIQMTRLNLVLEIQPRNKGIVVLRKAKQPVVALFQGQS